MYWPRADLLTEFCFGSGRFPPGLPGAAPDGGTAD
jgi:hypothetical protein